MERSVMVGRIGGRAERAHGRNGTDGRTVSRLDGRSRMVGRSDRHSDVRSDGLDGPFVFLIISVYQTCTTPRQQTTLDK